MIEDPRARRIRDKQRMKARARRTFAYVVAHVPPAEQQDFLRRCERLADNLAHCGNPCCNRRRLWEGPTIQEQRHEQAAIIDAGRA
jgi:hypothetical protein